VRRESLNNIVLTTDGDPAPTAAIGRVNFTFRKELRPWPESSILRCQPRPGKAATFYKEVFGFEEIRRIDNPRARGVILTDGAINISVLYFKQDQIGRGLDYTGLHSFRRLCR